MANLFDYLNWRGDLSLEKDPLRAVDSLILCRMSYVPFEDIVPPPGKGEPISIGEAARRFFEAGYESTRALLMPDDKDLLKALENSPRFSQCRLCGYVDKVSAEQEEQFSAVTVLLPNADLFVAFRGTDNTLVGWKEDFNMSFLSTVPSQQEAVEYVKQTAKSFDGEIYLGGHSKGGNLAVYAAAFCGEEIRRRIHRVYNNDGPGFSEDIIRRDGYQAVKERISTFVPQSSVVGMLLEHEEEYTVVHSTQMGIFQHDAYSWEVLGGDFVRMDRVTDGSVFIDRSLKDWVAGMGGQQRKQFFDALFSILGATEAQTMSELSAGLVKNAGKIFAAVKELDESTRKVMTQTISGLIEAAKKNLPDILARRKNGNENPPVFLPEKTQQPGIQD